MNLNSEIEKSYIGKYVTMDNGDIVYIKKFNYGILRTILGSTPSSVSYYLVDINGNIDKSEVHEIGNYEFTRGHYGIPYDNFRDIK